MPPSDHRDTATGSPGPAAAVTVERVPAPLTFPLRARVLRAGAPPDSVHLAVDDRPDTAAFAARTADGEVVGTAIVYPEACPWMLEHAHAWRLRGMATDVPWRDAGVGARVLAAVVDHVAASGGTLVWCNARVPARRFYERAGFRVHGDQWVDPAIGPHVAMWRAI